ncbi:neurogenic locus notch homolog protein 1-like [Orbicella faveolata]|uniref:neurogenic locus notch homolog protein 1-like n=1 Tax=Orbicella faveolata TaxID=48498 RepID=UPI0009E3EA0D|nr:neurogenic locus notch homolog protein 1-like [Orbicella faveolata]
MIAVFSNLLFLVCCFVASLSSVMNKASCSAESNILQENYNERLYSVHEFHSLNVPNVGTTMATDEFDCCFKCLRNPSCFSVNLAASQTVRKQPWCELLPSDKYNSPEKYQQNKSSHHISIMSPCSSSPCHNGGTCVPNYKENTFKCSCEKSFIGEYCEKGVESCKEVYDVYR